MQYDINSNKSDKLRYNNNNSKQFRYVINMYSFIVTINKLSCLILLFSM